jgi:hypothetical protein
MWHNNKIVKYVYVHHNPQAVFAVIDGISGWKRVRPGAADGVTNIGILLSTAKANGRKVHVFIVGDQITRAVLL